MTVFFSSEDSETCSSPSANPGFTVNAIPWDGLKPCYSLERLFSSDDNSNNSRARNETSGWLQTSLMNVTTLNSAAYDRRTNYSRIHYEQPTSFAERFLSDGESDPGSLAARTFRVYPNNQCSWQTGMEPDDFILEPAFLFNCMSGGEGSCHSTPIEILSFSIRWSDEYRDGDDVSKCTDNKELSRSGAVGLHASIPLAVLVGVASTTLTMW